MAETWDELCRLLSGGHLDELGRALTAENVNMRSPDGYTLLHQGVEASDIAAARLLISHGADVSCPDPRGYVALHYATSRLDYDMTRLLLEAGADPNYRDRKGHTPLRLAITQAVKDYNFIYLLVDHGADPRADPWIEQVMAECYPDLAEEVNRRCPKGEV